MSGGIPALSLKDEDVTKFLASSTHIGATNLDFQMEHYVFKRRSDGESSQKSKRQAVDCRRSTAAQFFIGEDDHEPVSAEQVVHHLNDALVPKEEQGTLKNLRIVQELIVHKEPKLLDNFLDAVISFQHDKNPEVRKFVLQFIEDVCKQIPQTLPKVVGNLDLMLGDVSSSVQKKVIQITILLYTVAIRWLCNVKNVDEIMVATWASMTVLKNKIFSLIDCGSEGISSLAVKFMEILVVTQTPKDQWHKLATNEMSLDDIPMILKIFRPKKMEEEALEIFQKIVDFHSASHISSCNLMACMIVLTTIGRKRFQFFSRVLQAFESLHANLPPTLSQSQVSSVRKKLKLHLFTLVKHPNATEFQAQISLLLSDLGATPQQISKCFPSIDPPKPIFGIRLKQVSNKRGKEEFDAPKTVMKTMIDKGTDIDATAEDLIPKFSSGNVADLALVSMLSLPDDMPKL